MVDEYVKNLQDEVSSLFSETAGLHNIEILEDTKGIVHVCYKRADFYQHEVDENLNWRDKIYFKNIEVSIESNGRVEVNRVDDNGNKTTLKSFDLSSMGMAIVDVKHPKVWLPNEFESVGYVIAPVSAINDIKKEDILDICGEDDF